MKPAVATCIVSLAALVQIALATAISGVIGAYLEKEFDLDGLGHMTSCGLSMKGGSVCTAAFLGTAVTIIVSLALAALQCGTAEGRLSLGFCGPILSSIGFFWWLAYAAAATAAAVSASQWESFAYLAPYRTAVVAMSWVVMALFLATFFVSAAAASSAARARAKLDQALSGSAAKVDGVAIKMGKAKRFVQPLGSPPVSPSKSSVRSYGSSAYDPFSESESPKKWAQPVSRRHHVAVTSDGLRTLLLVGGEPVPLSATTSPNLSPWGSPAMSPTHSPKARSPLAGRGQGSPTAQRSLQHGDGSGSGVGSFSNILIPAGTLDSAQDLQPLPQLPLLQLRQVQPEPEAQAPETSQPGQQ